MSVLYVGKPDAKREAAPQRHDSCTTHIRDIDMTHIDTDMTHIPDAKREAAPHRSEILHLYKTLMRDMTHT